ncbi:MAG: serine hydrolase [Burkholderiales bacterium]|nr:serine hydrolase [Burkholderiales bacterium]
MRLLLALPLRKAWLSSVICLAIAGSPLVASAQQSAPSSTSSSQTPKPKQTTTTKKQQPNKTTKTNKTATPKAAASKKAAPAGAPQGNRAVTPKNEKAPTGAKAVVPAANHGKSAAGTAAGVVAASGGLRSNVVFVQDLNSKAVLYSRNEQVVRPIASITKLMTAVIIVDAKLPMTEVIQITQADVDVVKHSRSRLAVGAKHTRGDLMHLALMSSENRAAHALGRTYPGGMTAFVNAMNAKARELGMVQSTFVEPTGLSSANVSTPRDLVKLLQASASRPSIRFYTTDQQYEVRSAGHPTLFRNTNMLVSNPSWDIKVSKTGFINEAGQCLVMVARINNRDTAIVLLNAEGKGTRIGDAIKIRQMIQAKQIAAAPVEVARLN